ncbi:MAG TPA: alpha/beta family hydrolase, partial [Kofleriaceae bacterium]|nr:alpha/beta family hydrolase [Kofleriaceae bacterium]
MPFDTAPAIRANDAMRAPRDLATAVDLGGHPGLVVRPAAARALYVLAHGAGAGMRHDFLVAIADALAARDVATLR